MNIRSNPLRLILSTICLTVSVAQSANAGDLDIVIRSGRIVDGTGSPWYRGDIGIRGEKIVEIGPIEASRATTVIDASGLYVAPGFIDMMGQTASPLLDDPRTALNLLTQGVTTINAGEGVSAAPLDRREELSKGWSTMAEYFAIVDNYGLPVNLAQTVGHTQLRKLVLGEQDRRPSEEELRQLQSLLTEAMEAGAIGISSALIYAPATYADTSELVELARVAGQFGGRYFTHMRNEGDQLLEAIDEALEIGRQADLPVHIFHLKTAGQQNWHKMPLAIEQIRAARAGGQPVTCDIYPYVNNGLGIAALIHPRHFAQGRDALKQRLRDASFRDEVRQEMESTAGWENWYRHAGSDWGRIIVGRCNVDQYKDLGGCSIAEIAAQQDEDPWQVFFTLVQADAFVLPETMSQANKLLALRQEFVSFCTDVGPSSGLLAAHPRAYGSFPRLLSHYVRDLGAISLERAVAQASAAAANNICAWDRGRIAVGLAADLVVFDYDRLQDHATFSKPHQPSTGVQHVLVNGQLVLSDGALTDARPGRVLRGPGFRQDLASHRQSSGPDHPAAASIDPLMHEFLQEHRLPGLSIAIADAGGLQFSRGYGWADVAARRPVTPESRFRIASLSKPITAVAILQLAEQGRLQLDTPVLEVIDCSAAIDEAGEAFDPRWRQITLRHLLEHRGGWDRDRSFDAMFQSVRFAELIGASSPADPAAVIRAMLRQPLDFDPGERYAYSNFGYCLLGRVIERLTDQSYESFVQRQVLAPLGIASMQIGCSRLDGRCEGEVRYYHPGSGPSVFESDLRQAVPWPYGGWYLEAMDAHGGWIASAPDLARFAAAFLEPDRCPILSAASVDLMHQRPPGSAGYNEDGSERDVYYSLGWQNRILKRGGRNAWHTGSLAGTATVMIRTHDGRALVGLMNSRVSPSSKRLSLELEKVLFRAAAMLDPPPTADAPQAPRLER